MKKWLKVSIVFVVFAILLISMALSATALDMIGFFSTDKDLAPTFPTNSCGEPMFVEELTYVNEVPVLNELANVFDDGIYGVKLNKGEYFNNSEYTVNKENGTVMWIKPGLCADVKFQINTDLNVIESKFIANEDPMELGYEVMRNTEGLTWSQKFKMLQIALDNKQALMDAGYGK